MREGKYMKLLELLQNKENLFIIDDIEDKKTKILVDKINTQLVNSLDKKIEFEKFAASQLEGAYHDKLVMAKSLKNYYEAWNAINVANANLEKEEANELSKFETFKNNLINDLNTLLKDSLKLPVICAYDVVGGEFYLPKKDHAIIVLGHNNTFVIENIIKEIEEFLQVKGNFSLVEAKELTANYVNVDKNVKTCKDVISELSFSKSSKMEKLYDAVDAMSESAKKIVFFETYKEEMKKLGCSNKEIDLLEKELFKKYAPLKKQLQKVLKVKFVTITDIVVEDANYENQFTREYDLASFNLGDDLSLKEEEDNLDVFENDED